MPTLLTFGDRCPGRSASAGNEPALGTYGPDRAARALLRARAERQAGLVHVGVDLEQGADADHVERLEDAAGDGGELHVAAAGGELLVEPDEQADAVARDERELGAVD